MSKWTVTGNINKEIVNENGEVVARVPVPNNDIVARDANANLLSSAPDMYEALKNLLEHTPLNDIEEEDYEAANQALLKAEGKS